MRMNKLNLILASLLTLAPLPCLANDTAFGGSGAAPIPIKKTDVEMLNEHIVISGYDMSRDDMKGRLEFDCDYRFKNLMNETLSFQMGFPFPVNDALGETTTPEGYTNKKGDALVYDFAVTVDGKSAPAKMSKITPLLDDGMNYTDAYLWQMTMAPLQTVNIHHHYITGITINSMGQNYVSFVLKTGALWKGGTISAAKFEVIPNTPTRMCMEIDKKADYLAPKPAGVQAIGWAKDRKYVWDLKNFQPKEDLELCLLTGKNYIRYYVLNSILQIPGYEPIDLPKLSKPELRILRNTVYAQYGKQFNDPALQAYFNKQWWYEANPQYSDSLLNENDQKAIALLEKYEAK